MTLIFSAIKRVKVSIDAPAGVPITIFKGLPDCAKAVPVNARMVANATERNVLNVNFMFAP